MLTLIDEDTREGLAIRVGRRLRSQDLIETLADAMLMRWAPEHIRSDNVLGRSQWRQVNRVLP
jgi:putative transposase